MGFGTIGELDLSRRTSGYSHQTISATETVQRAVSGALDIPEFQRGFVCSPKQVRDLAESLWLDYPIGFFLLWDNESNGNRAKRFWVVDGQQRVTSLCLMFKQEPRWWPRRNPNGWRKTAERYEVRFDIEATRPPFFRIPDSTISDEERFIPLWKLVTLSGEKELEPIVARIKSRQLCRGVSEDDVRARLDSIRRIRDKLLLGTLLDHDLESVFEIFRRLNSRGIRFRRLLLLILMKRLGAQWGERSVPYR
jgi:hypothetical protein